MAESRSLIRWIKKNYTYQLPSPPVSTLVASCWAGSNVVWQGNWCPGVPWIGAQPCLPLCFLASWAGILPLIWTLVGRQYMGFKERDHHDCKERRLLIYMCILSFLHFFTEAWNFKLEKDPSNHLEATWHRGNELDSRFLSQPWDEHELASSPFFFNFSSEKWWFIQCLCCSQLLLKIKREFMGNVTSKYRGS